MGSKRENVQLAYPADEKKLSKMPETVIFQRKLNGERVRVEWNLTRTKYTDAVTLYSSCNNPMPFFSRLKEELIDNNLQGLNFDGEMYQDGMSREDIHSICSRRVNPHPDENLLSLQVFDIINTEPQVNRISLIDSYLTFQGAHITKVQSIYDNKDKLIYYADQFIKEGFEGVIVRNPQGFYTPRKTGLMLKFKPSEQDTYLIVGYQEEEDIYGQPKGRLGSVLVRDDDNHIFSVGTGNALDAAGRNYWWQHRKELVGMLATVKHSSIMTVNGFPTCTSLLDIFIH